VALTLLAGTIKEGESKNAVLACNDWLRMGPGRSLPGLEKRYSESNQKQPPTSSIGTLKKWSSDYGWQARAEAYDKEIDAEKTAANDARRREIMESGLALEHERVAELYALFAELKREFTEHGLWYTDTKLSATGMTVEVEVFNKALIDSFRATLDDLAKETGGRKQKTEISGTNGGPVETRDVGIDYSKLSNEQIRELIRIAEFAQTE
jgi:hypothetical protein